MNILPYKIKQHLRTHYSYLLNFKKHILTNKPQIMIDNILENIRQSKYGIPYIQIMRINYVPKDDLFNEIPMHIKPTIENMNKYCYMFSFSIENRRNITIYMTYDKRPGEVVLKNNAEFIYRWIIIADNYSRTICSPSLTIFIYLTNHTKQLNICGVPYHVDAMDHISKKNINSAYTYACVSGPNSIYIYRKEEWHKSLIHEVFHAFGLDFISIYSNHKNNQISNIFGIHRDIALYEAYTEFWAEIINILFEYGETRLNSELQLQRAFSIMQSQKILAHKKLLYRDFCIRSTNDMGKNEHKINGKNRVKYNEDTPLFSYYIIKTIMMFYMAEFIEWCMYNNNGSLQFKLKSENLDAFIKWLLDHYNRPEFINIMDNSIFSIMNGQNNYTICKMKNIDMDVIHTLRMSIL